MSVERPTPAGFFTVDIAIAGAARAGCGGVGRRATRGRSRRRHSPGLARRLRSLGGVRGSIVEAPPAPRRAWPRFGRWRASPFSRRCRSHREAPTHAPTRREVARWLWAPRLAPCQRGCLAPSSPSASMTFLLLSILCLVEGSAGRRQSLTFPALDPASIFNATWILVSYFVCHVDVCFSFCFGIDLGGLLYKSQSQT